MFSFNHIEADDYSFGTAKVCMTTDREANFMQAREQIAESLNKKYGGKKDSNGNLVPYTADDVKEWSQKNNMILHEEGDGETINKVPGELHNTSVMYHQGGYSMTKVNANRVFNLQNQNVAENGGNASMNNAGKDSDEI